jgi:hypothetical protein
MTVSQEDVISWFKPRKVYLLDPKVKSHIESLTKYYDSPVATKKSTWRRLYTDCLTDIGYELIDTTDVTHQIYKKNQGYNPYQLEVTSDEFKTKTLIKKDEELNNMTKQDFVLLFAKTMNEIITEKEHAYEKQIDEKTEKANQESHKRDQQKIEQWCKNHPESCVEGIPTVDIFGGKSKKKSRKRNASKRRNRRTHNYKKK